jgi:hypothetical protein
MPIDCGFGFRKSVLLCHVLLRYVTIVRFSTLPTWTWFSCRRSGAFLFVAGIVLSTNLVKEDAKDHDRTRRCLGRNNMPKDHGRDTNGKHLSSRHDNSKNNRTKLLDGVKNTQLSTRRRNGRNDIVAQHDRIRQEKFVYNRNISSHNETRRGNENSRTVHTQHHLIGVDIGTTVLRVYLVLPLRREGIKANVHDEKDEANEFRCRILVRGLAQE